MTERSPMPLAIITARGGSKRIPRKNIRPFLGKPIIAYPIQAALSSGLFGEVMVSTDDGEIADVARHYGASIPFMRGAENSGDTATTADVLLEVIGEYAKRGMSFDTLCCLYPTAPFVTGDTLKRAMELLNTSSAEAVVPVVPFSYPPLRGFIVRDNRLSMRWPEYERARSQDLEPLYHDCGQFYIIKTQALAEQRTLFCRHTAPLILGESEVQDIDTQEDWALAEMKYKLLHERGGQTP